MRNLIFVKVFTTIRHQVDARMNPICPKLYGSKLKDARENPGILLHTKILG